MYIYICVLDDEKTLEVNDVIGNVVLALNQVNKKLFVLLHVLCLFLVHNTMLLLPALTWMVYLIKHVNHCIYIYIYIYT